MPAAKDHPELFGHKDYNVDPTDWVPAMMLITQIERELAERRIHLLRRLSTWYTLVGMFRQIEDRQMLKKEPSARDYEYHRAMLKFLAGEGAILRVELGNHVDIDPEDIGIPLKDVDAQITELDDDMRIWHGDMTEDRRKSILSDVFGSAE
jgi:hypothetical protein